MYLPGMTPSAPSECSQSVPHLPKAGLVQLETPGRLSKVTIRQVKRAEKTPGGKVIRRLMSASNQMVPKQ